MSRVKEKLQQWEAEFISLRETLTELAKLGEGCTLEDAAAYLNEKLGANPFVAPPFMKRGAITGRPVPMSNDEAHSADIDLMHIGIVGEASIDEQRYMDTGFVRSDLQVFLANDHIQLGEMHTVPPSLPEAEAAILKRLHDSERQCVELEQELDRLRFQLEDSAAQAAMPWPWGHHHTELLGRLEAAARRFWVNYDPSEYSTAPRNAQVIEWLEAQGVSNSIAKSIATILRVDGLPTGPRK